MPGIFDDLFRYTEGVALTKSQQPTSTPDEKGMSRAALITMLAGQGADVGTTLPMVLSGRFKEGNKLGLAGTMAGKGALIAALLTLHDRMPRKVADILGYSTGGIGGAAAVKNLHTYATADKK